MGEAYKIAADEMDQDNKKIAKLSKIFWNEISDIEEIYLNGNFENKVPNITNVSFAYIEGESLIMALKDVAVSSGSACTSASLEPSYVLRALGRADELAHSSIRFSFGRFTTEDEVLMVAKTTKKVVNQLRELSPLWDMYKDGVDLEKVEWVTH
jgi:cysteine desulfurase